MRKRNDPKPIQGWGWLGDAAEQAAVEAMAPAGRSKNARAAMPVMKPKRKIAASHVAKPGGGMQPTDDEYRQLAKQQYQSEGKIEIDPHARVSRSGDEAGEMGAFVRAWVFVYKPGRT